MPFSVFSVICQKDLKMYGLKVPKSNICVDYWDDEKEPQIRFLTHAHDNRLHNISNVKDKIYMSPFSLWYLTYVRKENFRGDVNCLTLNTRHKIDNKVGEEEKWFHVTLIDSNHCAGSVMFFFEGDFGQVLCTGDFRFTPLLFYHKTIKALINSKSLDILHVDNRFIAEHCNFPPKEDVVKETVEMLKSYPEHKIAICIGKWGKLDLLQAIAKEFQEKIKVDQTCMKVAERLGIAHFFTLQEARITTLETDLLNLKDVHTLKAKKGPTVLLVMNALFFTSAEHSEKKLNEYREFGLNMMPYSEHSNHEELYDFIDALRPNVIVPVVRQTLASPLDPIIARNCEIPNSIAVLQRSYEKGLGHEDSSGSAISDLLEDFNLNSTTEGGEPPNKRKKILSSTEEKDCSTANKSKVNTCEVEKGHNSNKNKIDSEHSKSNLDTTGEKFCSTANKSIVNTCEVEKEHIRNKKKNDSEYLKKLNYWSDQGITGKTFRHPDLKGVYKYYK